MKGRGWIGLFLFILLAGTVYSAEVNEEVIEALNDEEEVPVIVFLKDRVDNPPKNLDQEILLDERREMIKEVQEEVLNSLDVKEEPSPGNLKINSDKNYDFDLENKYSIINGFSGNVTKDGLDNLLESGLVEKVVPIKPIKISLDVSNNLISSPDAWSKQISGINITGEGETVCVIDTGVDYTHSTFGGCDSASFLNGSCNKVIGGQDIANGDNDPKDVNSHGTHVAGIVASNDSTFRGVAPGAKIVALKVFTDAGNGNTDWAITAIDWCVNNASIFNISAITMSIGVTDGNGDEILHSTDCNSADTSGLASAASSAVAQGIFVDASAGNAAGTTGVSSPACGENVTSVGSVYDANVGSAAWSACTDSSTAADQISCFSNTASNLDLLAPGAQIKSTILSSNFGNKGGTSMAAPHVAGLALLLNQYWSLAYNQTITPKQIEHKLKITGKMINDSRNHLTFSRINALKAIQPYINYSSSSLVNGTTISITSATINITSDVNLTGAFLEWNHQNGTIENITMEQENVTSFSYTINDLNESNYSYKTYGNDSVNTFGESEGRILFLDDTKPNITFYTPLNNSYWRGLFNLNISIENNLLDQSNYSILNSSSSVVQENINSSVNAANFTWNDVVNSSNSTFPDGNYTFSIFSNDSLSNSITKSVNFIIDNTVPLLFEINKTPEIVYNNDTVLFQINTTDINLNTSAIIFTSNFSGDWTNYTMDLESGDRYNFSLSGMTNLTNQKLIEYEFQVIDLAGNVNLSESFSFTVQNRVPTNVNITNPENGTVIEVGDTTEFNSNSSDDDGDSLTYTWNFSDGSNLVTGQNPTHQFTSTGDFLIILNVTDSYNDSLTNTTIIINDTKEPSIGSLSYDSEIHLESDGSSQNVTATNIFDYSGILSASLSFNESLQTASCSDENTSWNCSWGWSNLTVGDYNFSITTEDNFTTTHTNITTYSFAVVSCSDGVENGDETDTDCGGSCSACPSSGSSDGGGGSGGGGGAGGAMVTSDATSTEIETIEDESGSSSDIDSTSEETIEATDEEPALPDHIAESSKKIIFSKGINNIDFEQEGLAITEIELDLNVDKEVDFKITSFTEKPEEVTGLGNVYQFLKIDSGLTGEEVEKAKIKFVVPISWLDENNFSRKTVKLNVFREGGWKELSTKLLEEFENEINYRATVNGFSYFAITAQQQQGSWINVLLSSKSGKRQLILIGFIVFIAILLVVYYLIREN